MDENYQQKRIHTLEQAFVISFSKSILAQKKIVKNLVTIMLDQFWLQACLENECYYSHEPNWVVLVFGVTERVTDKSRKAFANLCFFLLCKERTFVTVIKERAPFGGISFHKWEIQNSQIHSFPTRRFNITALRSQLNLLKGTHPMRQEM